MKKWDFLEQSIIDVYDYPKKGICFKDITPLFLKPELINDIINEISDFALKLNADAIAGAESRGFLFGVPVSLKINKPFILIRKPNKLPRAVYRQSYDLEYGSSTLEMHQDALKANQRVLIIDDLLATGGTVEAIEKIVRQANAIVAGSAFLIELKDLKGRQKLSGEVLSLLKY